MVHTSKSDTSYNEELGYFDPFYNENIGLIHYIVKSFGYYYTNGTQRIDPDDLLQEATIAFYKSFLAYESSKNASFNTYSVIRMKGSIQRFVRDNGHTIRKPRFYAQFESICKQYNIVSRSQLKDYEDVFATVGITLKRANKMYLTIMGHTGLISLDKSMSTTDDGVDTTLLEVIESTPSNCEQEDLEFILSTLNISERDKLCIKLKYQGYNQKEIGEKVGLSQMSVSRTLRKTQDVVYRAIKKFYSDEG